MLMMSYDVTGGGPMEAPKTRKDINTPTWFSEGTLPARSTMTTYYCVCCITVLWFLSNSLARGLALQCSSFWNDRDRYFNSIGTSITD